MVSFSYESAMKAALTVINIRKSAASDVANSLRELAENLRKLKHKVDMGELPKEEGHYVMVASNVLRGKITTDTIWAYPKKLEKILRKFDELNEKLMIADVFVDLSRGVENYRHFSEAQLREAIETSGIRDLPPADVPVYGFVDSEDYLPFLLSAASLIAEDALALAGELDAFANELDKRGSA